MRRILLFGIIALALAGCKEYAGLRVCKKDTNDCQLYLSTKYETNYFNDWGAYDRYNCTHSLPGMKVTVETRQTFLVFLCSEYDFYEYYR